MARQPFLRFENADLVLFRHFFSELFESDLLSVRDRLLTVLMSSLSLLAAFGLLLPLMFNHKYHLLNAMDNSRVYQESALADKLMFICLSFAVASLGTLLRWQSLFPDTRDFLILGPLPLHRFQIFRAKLGALLLFITLLILGVNVLPSLSLPAVMSGQWQLPHGSLLHILALFISCCFAGVFAFFSLLAIQGLLLNLLPVRWAAHCLLILQAVLLMFVLAAIPLLLWIPDLHASLLQWPQAAFWSPPAWFLGCEEELLGLGNQFTASLAKTARWALALAILAALSLYAITYSRNIGQVLESEKKRRAGIFGSVQSTLLWRVAGSPPEAAVLSFILKTLFRSRVHKLLLAAIGGVCCSLIIDSFVSLFISRAVLHQKVQSTELQHAALSAPLVIGFFLLCGLRYLFLLPVETRANWLFRTGDAKDATAMVSTEKALLLLGVLPVAFVTLVGTTIWMGLVRGAIQTGFVALLSLILLEALLWNWDRIPFTCPYLPGKRNLIQSFLIYGLALSSFAYLAAFVEALLLDSVAKMIGLLGSLLSVFIFMRVHRKRSGTAGIPLKFDDLPEPEIYTLGLQPE